MKYYENGDLHSYLDETQGVLCWRDIVDMLWGISGGIEEIHRNDLIHGNLHGGNVLIENESDSIDTCITDIGLHNSIDKKTSNQIYGVLPYVAPDILKGNPPTKASDIYTTEICFGLRPKIINGTPEVYVQLMTQCWHSDPLKRPTASKLNIILEDWINAICDNPIPTKISDQFDIAEEKKFLDFKFHNQKIHSQAFYTSTLLHLLN
ncbi:16168_t:CDS:2 [Funneliformis geosporum]|uniref:16168_t:CDS:1 n=1 Tax=Funneliformis geosporum TaxID=1117311 RepID=A0A9W4WUB8_9GLOM|nr:16168_t:CDS:2 [Funneliformis geosporum]